MKNGKIDGRPNLDQSENHNFQQTDNIQQGWLSSYCVSAHIYFSTLNFDMCCMGVGHCLPLVLLPLYLKHTHPPSLECSPAIACRLLFRCMTHSEVASCLRTLGNAYLMPTPSERDVPFFFSPLPILAALSRVGCGCPGIASEAPERSQGPLPNNRGALRPRAARGGVQNGPARSRRNLISSLVLSFYFCGRRVTLPPPVELLMVGVRVVRLEFFSSPDDSSHFNLVACFACLLPLLIFFLLERYRTGFEHTFDV